MTCTPSNERLNDLASAKSWNGSDQILVLRYLREMRDEIDRLTKANEAGSAAVMNEQREAAKLRAELKAAEDDAMEESDRADRNAERVAKLRAELDAAHTDAALARDANNGEVQLLKSQLQLAIERIERVSVKADSAEHWERVAKKAEAALAKATTATDPDAKLRELLQWLGKNGSGGWVSTPAMEGKIVSLFTDPNRLTEPAKPAEPAPDHVPDAGKMVPAPTDDTRELVAQGFALIADYYDDVVMSPVYVETQLRAIAAQLRGCK